MRARAGNQPPPEDVTPLDAALEQKAFVDRLRESHLAREDALPLIGAKKSIAPPPHIQNEADMDALVNRYADMAQAAQPFRDWYRRSGAAVAYAAGEPGAIERFGAGAARTSPQTDVASNAMHAITLHNQAMLGDPLRAGRFPNVMGPAVERYYYGGEPVTGEKIGPFQGGVVEEALQALRGVRPDLEWNPYFAHSFVNDVHNMRAAEFPPNPGRGTEAGLYTGSPTGGQHNFTRILANRAGDELNRRTGLQWTPKQVQAAAWVYQVARSSGKSMEEAAQDFADGLRRNYAQLSWESAPGLSTNHLPEFHTASPELRQEFHDRVRDVLTDAQGRDVIARHLGLLTGPTIDAPGYFEGAVNPGSQTQVSLGQAKGGFRKGVDQASRDLANVDGAIRGLLLRQNAFAWHKPAWVEGTKPAEENLADVRIGRPLTHSEAVAIGQAMADKTGSDFFSPIGTAQGYRFLNVPEASGIKNKDFQNHVDEVVGMGLHPDAHIVSARSDNGYLANNWQEHPNGENFVKEIGNTGRPDLQRRAAELLATLGPAVAEIEEDFAREHGWTPNRASRIWETSPIIQRYGGAVVPNPPQPWQQRPAPQGSRPFDFQDVDHDPFALAVAARA